MSNIKFMKPNSKLFLSFIIFFFSFCQSCLVLLITHIENTLTDCVYSYVYAGDRGPYLPPKEASQKNQGKLLQGVYSVAEATTDNNKLNI